MKTEEHARTKTKERTTRGVRQINADIATALAVACLLSARNHSGDSSEGDARMTSMLRQVSKRAKENSGSDIELYFAALAT